MKMDRCSSVSLVRVTRDWRLVEGVSQGPSWFQVEAAQIIKKHSGPRLALSSVLGVSVAQTEETACWTAGVLIWKAHIVLRFEGE